MKAPDAILAKLADLIQQGRFAELETEAVEIKPVPATGAEWKEVHKSVNAFEQGPCPAIPPEKATKHGSGAPDRRRRLFPAGFVPGRY